MGLTREDILGRPRQLWQQFEFQPFDALTAWVPEGEATPIWLQEAMAHLGDTRVYPGDGGNLYKLPYTRGVPYEREHFQLEAGAWDHEHCDVCGGRISTGDRLWLAAEGPQALLCAECAKELLEFDQPWWKFW